MPLSSFARLVFLSVVTLFAAFPSKAATWPIEVDGKHVDALWYSLSDTPERLVVGDVLYVGNEQGGMWLCVRDVENLSFVNRLSSEALLYRKIAGNLVPIGFDNSMFERRGKGSDETAEEKEETASPKPKLVDTPPSTAAALWGIHIGWDDEPTAALKHVRIGETFCSIRSLSGVERPIYYPPECGFRCLDLEWTAPAGDALNRFFSPTLAFLRLSLNGEATHAAIDATHFAKANQLRALFFTFSRFENSPSLAALSKLRYLNLSYARDLKLGPWIARLRELKELNLAKTPVADLSPLADLPSLQQIDLSCTQVKDLTPLASLPSLESLSLEFTQVEALPNRGFEKLKLIAALGSNLKASAVDQFTAAHPRCIVRFSWKQELFRTIQGVDRLVVRSGGTCHRRLEKEKILFETHTAGEITGFLGTIDIDESMSNGACMCCGSPSLEFYHGDTHLAMVGIQHGHALRWRSWPADGALTSESARAFTEWLAKRGVSEPYEELNRTKAAQKASERREAAFDKALEPAARKALGDAEIESGDQFVEILAKAYPRPSERTIAVLRLIGAEEDASWNLSEPRTDGLISVLAKMEPAALGAALVQASHCSDHRVTSGAARIFFSKANWERLDEETRRDAVQPLALWAASSPRHVVRVRTLRALETMRLAEARDTLRRIAAANAAVRTLSPEQEIEGGQWKEFAPNDDDVPESASAALHAVLCLARLADSEATPLLEKLRPTLQAADADVVVRVEAILKNPQLADEDRKTSGTATLKKVKNP